MRWLVQSQSEQEADRRKVPKLADLLKQNDKDRLEAARDWTAAQTAAKKKRRKR